MVGSSSPGRRRCRSPGPYRPPARGRPRSRRPRRRSSFTTSPPPVGPGDQAPSPSTAVSGLVRQRALRPDAEALQTRSPQNLPSASFAVAVHGRLRLLPGEEEEGQPRRVQPGVRRGERLRRGPGDVRRSGAQGVHGALIVPLQLPEGDALRLHRSVGPLKEAAPRWPPPPAAPPCPPRRRSPASRSEPPNSTGPSSGMGSRPPQPLRTIAMARMAPNALAFAYRSSLLRPGGASALGP